MAGPPILSRSELRSLLEADFRNRVTLFYRALQITPPYHSVEKALLALRERLKTLPEADLRAADDEASVRDKIFSQIFTESGLAKKSRGIITALLAEHPERLAPECRPFAEAFTQAPP